jgi:hypothetical protein
VIELVKGAVRRRSWPACARNARAHPPRAHARVAVWSGFAPSAATYVFSDRRAGGGSGEVPGRALSLAAARSVSGRGSYLACVPAGCRGEAWLKKGLLSLK